MAITLTSSTKAGQLLRLRLLRVAISLVLSLGLLQQSIGIAAAVTISPHMFGSTTTNYVTYGDGTRSSAYHNDTSSPYNDPGTGAFYTWKWPSGTNWYYSGLYKFGSTFPTTSSWRNAVSAGITTWNNQPYWSPIMSLTTGSTYDIIFEYKATSECAGAGTHWKACAWLRTGSTASKTAAEYAQWWVITLNTAWSWGVGQSGRLDIQSVITNELGHAWYLNHNASWTEGVVQAEACVWGSSTCVDSAGRTVSCSNCGSRRTVLIGDKSTLDHIYGAQGGGAAPTAESGKQAGEPDTWQVPNDRRPVAAEIGAP